MGLIPSNYNNFRDTPFESYNGDISSDAYYQLLTPGYRVKLISNTDIRIILLEEIEDSPDFDVDGIYIPKDTYYEFNVHMYRKHFYCESISEASEASEQFVNITYINGFVQ